MRAILARLFLQPANTAAPSVVAPINGRPYLDHVLKDDGAILAIVRLLDFTLYALDFGSFDTAQEELT
jgi:hypothetical protein